MQNQSLKVLSVVFGLALGLTLVPGCNTAPPVYPIAREEGLETLAVLGSNDIHGNLAPIQMKTDDQSEKGTFQVSYEGGGAANIASYIDILRSEFGDHLIWLDAGDQFQGTIESNYALGAPMVQFFNFEKLTASAVGNHEFDFGVPALKSRMSESTYPYLTANISDAETHQRASFPNTKPNLIVTVGKLKIGIIGLTTLDTPKTTRASNVKTLEFDSLRTTTVREAENLRKLGAHVILITAHVGLDCGTGRSVASSSYQMRKQADPQGSCKPSDEMVRLLESLPAGTVDAVVAGHSHTIVHHWVAGVPVIQAGSYGRYLNVIYLTYDWAQGKIITDRTRIEGPIPICRQVFQNQGDCNGDRPVPKTGRGPLVNPTFHGRSVTPSQAVEKLILPVIKTGEEEKNRKIGFAERKIEHIRFQESPLGDLIADSIRKSAKTDFALVNSGGIRASLESGVITYGAIFRTMPFDNAIAIVNVTGRELLTILKVATSGSRDFASTSGLRIKMIDLSTEAPLEDLDGTGKLEPWETNRLIEARTLDGDLIDPKKKYTLATLDFLVTGGDDMKWPMSRIPQNRILLDSGTMVRDAFVTAVAAAGPINSVTKPIIDPDHPRLTFVKGGTIVKKRKRTRKSGPIRNAPQLQR